MAQFPDQFKYDPEYLQDRYNDFEHSFKERNPEKDYAERLYELTAEFVRAEKLNYLRFAPYWDSVRDILYRHFKHLDFKDMSGGSFMPMFYDVKDPATGEKSPLLTLIAAWEFKEYYDKHCLQGTADFQLWGDDESRWWNATDPYWELLFDMGELPR